MSKKSWVTGFARIGERRELKKVLEKYWREETSFEEVLKVSNMLKKRHWRYQQSAGIDLISINDFSLYDQTLDMIDTLGLIPDRFKDIEDRVKRYFAMARGDRNHTAMEMTKWFNTNYHYIVPELRSGMKFNIDISKIASEYKSAKLESITPKINIIGPLTLLGNAKRVDSSDLDALTLFNEILPAYSALFEEISKLDEEVIVQVEEPILVTDKSTELSLLIKEAYTTLAEVSDKIEIYVVTYFDHAKEAVLQLIETPIKGIGLDFVYGKENFDILDKLAESSKLLVAGIVDGRNIWINDIV